MRIDSLKLIYFSPTETTRKLVSAIAQGFPSAQVDHLNLTMPESASSDFANSSDGLAIIGMPVYGGRLPAEAVARLRRIHGNSTPAVVVVLYGNRAYDDALIELRDLAVELGFLPIAAGAFVGEHSFSDENTLIAHRRPDQEDLMRAAEFGAAVRARLDDISSLEEAPPMQVPGNIPYADYRVLRGVSPVSDDLICTRCGTCATVCPTGAITMQDNKMVTDVRHCILCCACVKNCTTGGRELLDERIGKLRSMLVSKFSARKEPETYFSL